MLKYELKKIFSKRINQVLLAAVLVVTIIYSGMAIGSMRYVDEEGQDHTGIEAGRLLAEDVNQWKGELTTDYRRRNGESMYSHITISIAS